MSDKTKRLLGKARRQSELQKELKRDAADQKLRADHARLKEKYQHAIRELEQSERRETIDACLRSPRVSGAFSRASQRTSSPSTAILVLTDWHCEERVEPEVCSGLNTYSPRIAQTRIERVFQKAIEMLEWSRHFAKIDQLCVALLGDMITGYIHEELVEGNFLSPQEATLFARDRICDGLDFLRKESKCSLLVPCVHGNHGRSTQKKRVATSYKNSFEWRMYHEIERLYRRDPKISFKIENGIHNWVELQGRSFRFHHGDSFGYQGGVGGLSIPVNKKISQWNKSMVADYDIFGHWHQFLRHWKWISCGCLIGYNAYALMIGAEYQEPSQTFMVVNRTHGLIVAEPVFV